MLLISPPPRLIQQQNLLQFPDNRTFLLAFTQAGYDSHICSADITAITKCIIPVMLQVLT